MPPSAVPSAAIMAAAKAGNVDMARLVGDTFSKLAEKAKDKASSEKHWKSGRGLA
jgi:hypothetical protein